MPSVTLPAPHAEFAARKSLASDRPHVRRYADWVLALDRVPE